MLSSGQRPSAFVLLAIGSSKFCCASLGVAKSQTLKLYSQRINYLAPIYVMTFIKWSQGIRTLANLVLP
jgi:hypothetical protein